VQKADSDEHHLVELAVVDAAGRLQIPREYLEQFNIRRRVQVELTENGILIRPPEREHHSDDHASASSAGEQAPAESDSIEISSSLLKAWQRLKFRFTRSSKNHNGDEK
jgi:bifunctional DNA-binding transcriptional regulator/antitoxin component of YhaV-PrlF toxin-antitoxin module